MNCLLRSFHNILIGLSSGLKNVVLKLFFGRITCVLGVVVLLHDSRSLETLFLNKYPEVFLQNLLV